MSCSETRVSGKDRIRRGAELNPKKRKNKKGRSRKELGMNVTLKK